MKKIILSGLLAGLAMVIASLALSQLFNLIFPSVQAEYMTDGLFRPWSDPLMSLIFVEPFVVGIILAWIWSKVKELYKDEQVWKRGVKFGLIYGAVGIPGMIMSYSCFPLSLLMIATWTLSIFVQALLGGLVLAKMIR